MEVLTHYHHFEEGCNLIHGQQYLNKLGIAEYIGVVEYCHTYVFRRFFRI